MPQGRRGCIRKPTYFRTEGPSTPLSRRRGCCYHRCGRGGCSRPTLRAFGSGAVMVRIVKIHATTASMQSNIRNAYGHFTQMTTSVFAVVTDVVRGGKPVIGYGFNSNGRYAATGLLKERFVPRLERATPASLLTDAEDNLDPHRIWQTMMTGEKPGGHGE